MNRNRKISQPLNQRLLRPLSRRLARSCVRRILPRPRGPDELSQALTAFRRALRCHRQLAKLAPRFFDTAVVHQEALERAERCRWMALWEPILNKVYGLPPDTPSSETDWDLPPLPSRVVQRKVDGLLAELRVGLEAGGRALQLYRQCHPHALPSFRQLAQLLDLASALGRCACGVDPSKPALPPPNYDQVWADLARAYPSAS